MHIQDCNWGSSPSVFLLIAEFIGRAFRKLAICQFLLAAQQKPDQLIVLAAEDSESILMQPCNTTRIFSPGYSPQFLWQTMSLTTQNNAVFAKDKPCLKEAPELWYDWKSSPELSRAIQKWRMLSHFKAQQFHFSHAYLSLQHLLNMLHSQWQWDLSRAALLFSNLTHQYQN